MRKTPTLDSSHYSRARTVGLVTVFLWFLIGGIAHFALTDLETLIVPPYIPWARAAVLVSGLFELVGATGLLWSGTRRASAWLLFMVTLAVTPVHIWMLQTAGDWNVPLWALVARLPLQVGLLVLIVWSTNPSRTVPSRFYADA